MSGAELFDFAIIGAGMAGASLAAELAPHARVLLIEAEDVPGYHATGRSAAFWDECYGGPEIVPLTLASLDYLTQQGVLSPRGAVYLSHADHRAEIDAFIARFAPTGARIERLDTAALAARVPHLRPDWAGEAVAAPFCADIDVAGLHQHYLGTARRHGVQIVCRARLAEAGCPIPATEAKARYGFVREVVAKAVTQPATRPKTWTDSLDRVLTHKLWGTLIFLALIPRLRDVVIRTFGEAMTRCKAVTDAMAGVQPVEWDITAQAGGGVDGRANADAGLARIDHYPYRQVETSRGVRRTPLHEHLKARGAVFGEVAGWERANWFARPGQEREYRYSWWRQNWFDNQRDEHLAVRNAVGLFDMTSFGKIRVEGRDALAFLQRLCANDLDVPPGRIVYTQMLNQRGGIESDLTVTRLSKTAFFLVVPGATLQRDLAWLRKHLGDEFAIITDVTSAESVLCLMGPKARELIQKISPNDFSNEAFAFGTAREIEIGMGLARAHRVTYVGELGWELYVSTEQAEHVFEAIEEAGADVGLKLCGLHTLDSCRIEKAFRHFGHDITDEDDVLEAGLGFAVKTAKGDFIGRDAVLKKREAGLSRRMVQFRLKDAEPLLFHN